MGPEFVSEIREVVTALENDDRVKVVVFESDVDGFFLNHSDFLANFEELTSIPQGPTGLEAWPDVLVRLTRAPFVSIALIRGRATGNGSELVLACTRFYGTRVSRRLAGQIFGPLFRELAVEQPGRLADFDHVAVGVPHVAADLGAAIEWRRHELGSL